jgi:ketosteroid isomerase-like protein
VEWAVLGLFITFLIVTYIVVQGTRAALAWRKAAAEGDVKVIRDIVEDSLGVWRSMKRPKDAPAEVWRGIQSMQIVEVDAELIRVSCQAEGDYKLVNGRWVETANPLHEAMAITAKALDMLLYELPHYKPGRVQIDAYMTMREADRLTERVCILSTTATRDDARQVDWEEWTSAEIIEALGGRYRMDDLGQPLSIAVQPPKAPQAEDAGTPPAPSKT